MRREKKKKKKKKKKTNKRARVLLFLGFLRNHKARRLLSTR